MNQGKQQKYLQLVEKYRQHRFSDPQLLNPFQIEGVQYEHNVINPWSLWHGNLDAEILFLGQDWGDVNYFKRNFSNDWQDEKDSPTNNNLKELFSILGYDIGLPNSKSNSNRLPLFFTNAILGIKESKGGKGSMAAKPKKIWYKESEEYLNGLIEIIKPNYIIVMGRFAYNCFNEKQRISKLEKITDVIDKNVEKSSISIITDNGQPKDIRVFGVAHCSGLGLRNRSFEQQKKDWEVINNTINESPCPNQNL